MAGAATRVAEGLGSAAWLAVLLSSLGVLVAPSCSVNLDHIACVNDDECREGQVCSHGTCKTTETPDLSDIQVDTDTPSGLPWECPLDDCPDFASADEDGDGVDGDTEVSIYVDNLAGDDTDLGTFDRPVKTADAAFSLLSEERYVVIMTAHTYDLAAPLEIEGLDFFEIAGGYDRDENDSWTRHEDARTSLRGTNPVLALVKMGEVRLSGVKLDATAGGHGQNGEAGGVWSDPPAAQPTQGDTSIAIVAVDSTLRLYRSTVTANRGGHGGDGRSGRSGAEGAEGTQGDPPLLASDCRDENCEKPDGGTGGTLPTWCGSHASDAEALSATGGEGGPGSNGISREPGLQGGNGDGGLGGSDGAPDGLAGGDGGTGEHTGGSNGLGYLCQEMWYSRDGGSGAFGLPGYGGGGGAGGTHHLGGYGSGGGGGGSGGCGGEGGGGGAGGGGSIGILAIDSDIEATNTTVAALSGGDGGAAGASGTGGRGGSGADPVDDTTGLANVAMGGKGGHGGRGGAGGGGAGGDGGVSVALVQTDGCNVTSVDALFNSENGGIGGMGTGGEASRGADGYAGPFLTVGIDETSPCPAGN